MENIVAIPHVGAKIAEKEPLHFFKVKAEKQTKIMLRALPHLKPFLDEMRRIIKMQDGGEKAKEAKLAQQELITLEAMMINKKEAEVSDEVVQARLKAAFAFDEAKKEEAETGLEILESVITNALQEHYKNALEVLALFDNKTPETLEQEKDIFELAEMLFDILESEKVANFLLRAQQFKSKMQLGILRR